MLMIGMSIGFLIGILIAMGVVAYNDGNYESDNCRWVNRLIQGKNKRNNVVISAFGESKIVAEWSRDARCVVNSSCLGTRIKRGWDHEKAITTKIKKRTKT